MFNTLKDQFAWSSGLLKQAWGWLVGQFAWWASDPLRQLNDDWRDFDGLDEFEFGYDPAEFGHGNYAPYMSAEEEARYDSEANEMYRLDQELQRDLNLDAVFFPELDRRQLLLRRADLLHEDIVWYHDVIDNADFQLDALYEEIEWLDELEWYEADRQAREARERAAGELPLPGPFDLVPEKLVPIPAYAGELATLAAFGSEVVDAPEQTTLEERLDQNDLNAVEFGDDDGWCC